MVTRYASNEHLKTTLDLFHKLGNKYIYTWNEMIARYSQNRLVDKTSMKLHC